MTWPLPATVAKGFDQFAQIFNQTGTNYLTSAMKGKAALSDFRSCVVVPPGGKPGPLCGGTSQ